LLSSRAKLKRIFSDLIDELHTQYTITYEPANVRQQGVGARSACNWNKPI
jgi:hypothetical protein